MLEDRRSLRVFRRSGDSVEVRRTPSFSSASGDFKDDTALSSGGTTSLNIPSDSGVRRFPALRVALTARWVGGFEGPARFAGISRPRLSVCGSSKSHGRRCRISADSVRYGSEILILVEKASCLDPNRCPGLKTIQITVAGTLVETANHSIT